MRHTALVIGALVLLLIGAAGLLFMSVWPTTFSNSAPTAPASSPGLVLGERIYYTGTDASGPIPRTIPGAGVMGFGMMGNSSCVDCHGTDAAGGRFSTMLGTLDVPDIRYKTLTTSHAEEGTPTAAWTDADIARAIREGIEPGGQLLASPMPRWNMSDTDVTAVIAYLKELDKP